MPAAAPRVVTLILAVLAGLAVAAPPAAAQTAVRGPVTDEAGVLSGPERAAVEARLAEGRQRGVDLHVLLVEGTGGVPATERAQAVARASSMGGDDALLLVAFTDRTYALWTSDGLGIDPREISAILDGLVAPRLRADDVPGAVGAAVDGAVRARGGGRSRDRGSGGGGLPLLPLLLGCGLVLFLVARLIGRRRRGPTAGPAAPEALPADVGALDAEANAALVRVDDQLRDAEHEGGFAEAQFGAEEAGALRAGVEQARAELRQAFALRQQLDDEVPEAPHEQVAMLEALRGHVTAAEAVLRERLARLEELRGIERDPATAAAEIRSRAEGLAGRLPATEATAAEVRAAAPAAATAVDGNVAEAGKRLAFARERLTEADGAPPADAARALRAGGAALAQAEQLLDAVDDLAERVRTAREVLPQELQEAEIALARAEDLFRSRRQYIAREARTRLAEAQRRFDAARGHAERDPAAATAEADAAERLADEAFDLAWQDVEHARDDDRYGGRIQGFGWGLPVPIALPIPMGGGLGWGGSSWGGGGFGGSVGGGSFGGGGSVGGGRW